MTQCVHGVKLIYLFHLFDITEKDPKVTNMSHSNESVVNTKRTKKIHQKLIKKTTDTNYREYLQLTKKSNTG